MTEKENVRYLILYQCRKETRDVKYSHEMYYDPENSKESNLESFKNKTTQTSKEANMMSLLADKRKTSCQHVNPRTEGLDTEKNSKSFSKQSSCGNGKNDRTVGSSKRKRKLPVQYLKRTSVKLDCSDHKEDSFVTSLKDTEDAGDDRVSRPTKYSILQADRKKAIVPSNLDQYPYPAYPDVDDEIPRSVEPRPRTTICYKPSPDMDAKGTNLPETKEKSKEHVAEIVRKMQEDFEAHGLPSDNELLHRNKTSPPHHGSPNPDGASFESQNNALNVTVGQTYNLDLFRRIAGKAQIKSKEFEKHKKQFLVGGCRSKPHDSDSSTAWLKWMMTSSLPQRNCLGEQLSPESTRAMSPQHLVNR